VVFEEQAWIVSEFEFVAAYAPPAVAKISATEDATFA
jgi:hypothetical protein